MRNGYYESNTCYYMSSRKHRRILRKRIRSACNIIIGICALMVVGILGSADMSDISLTEFFIHETINACVLLVSMCVRANV